MDRTTLIDLSWAFNFLTDDLQIAKLPDYQYLIFVQSYLINSRKQKPKLLQALTRTVIVRKSEVIQNPNKYLRWSFLWE